MRAKRLRFLVFRGYKGMYEIACIDAGTAGHGKTLFAAVQCLAENVQAGIEMTEGTDLEFLCKARDFETEVFDAIKQGRPVPRAALKATGYSGQLIGIGELALVSKPKPHVDIGHLELERIGA